MDKELKVKCDSCGLEFKELDVIVGKTGDWIRICPKCLKALKEVRNGT